MRLLQKSEVNKLKTLERQSEIDQGLMLSKRVDALRQTAADEEASLEAFRHNTINKINLEISDALRERNELLTEVAQLDKKLENGTKENDAKKVELENEYKIANERVIELDNKLGHIKLKETDIELIQKYANEEKERATNERKQAEYDRRQSDAMYKNLQEEIQKFTATVASFEQKSQEFELTSAIKIKAIEAREQANDVEKERLDKISVELGNKERAINDKYNSLLQAQKHIKG